ncbi:DUF2793 domain-containing protein [Gemmobacter lanyuensis]
MRPSAPAQAQKHVTHNEALQILDALAQLSVEGFGAQTPPVNPAVGQIWALGPAPMGEWAGQGAAGAAPAGGLDLDPLEGWRAWGRAEGELRICRGGAWQRLPLENMAGLGIATPRTERTAFGRLGGLAVQP